MKIAISVPDSVFKRAERLAKRRRMSRSELYTKALVAMLEAEPKDELTRAYDSAFEGERTEAFADEAARRALADVEWSDR